MRCVRCNYELAGYREHRCPECGLQFCPEGFHSDEWDRHAAHETRVFAVAFMCVALPAGLAFLGLIAAFIDRYALWPVLFIMLASMPLGVVGLGLCFCTELRARTGRVWWVVGAGFLSIVSFIAIGAALPVTL